MGLEQLLIAIDAALVVNLSSKPALGSRIRRLYPRSLEGGAIIDEKRFERNLVFLRARGPAFLLDRYRRFRVKHVWSVLSASWYSEI